MNEKKLLDSNPDLTNCPISRQTLCHPIHVDGRHYELKKLFEWASETNINPITKKTLTSIIYDTSLRNFLNDHSVFEMENDYDKKIPLKNLQQLVNPNHIPKNQIRQKSIATFTAFLLFFLIYQVLFEESNTQSDTIHLFSMALLLSLGDYAIRQYSQDRYNLFSTPDLFFKKAQFVLQLEEWNADPYAPICK